METNFSKKGGSLSRAVSVFREAACSAERNRIEGMPSAKAE